MSEEKQSKWWKGSWIGQCHISHSHGNGSCKYDYTKDTSTPCISGEEENVEIIGYDDYGPILTHQQADLILAAVNSYDSHIETIKELMEFLYHDKECTSIGWQAGKCNCGLEEAYAKVLNLLTAIGKKP